MRVLNSRPSFWTAAAVVALALWTSAAPTMTYPLYQRDWHLTAVDTSWVFAVYPVVLVAVLVIFGDLSDHIGRRAAMLLGLSAELVGVLLFAVGGGLIWILIGRAFMGLGVGLSLSPASVAMVEFSAPGTEKRAGSVATSISAVGIALAMIVGGALTEYAPWPLHLNFAVLAVVIALVLAIAWFLPRHTDAETAEPWRVRAIVIPRGRRAIFVTGAVVFASSFLLGAVVLPLGAQIAHQLAGSTNALVTGLLLSVFAIAISVTALVFRRLPVWIIATAGALMSAAGIWLFVLTGATHSLVLFFLASAVSGIGYSLNFMGGLTLLSRYAAAHHRASMVSGGYLAGYISQGIGAPALGAVVTVCGLDTALLVGASVFSAVFAAAVALSATVGRMANNRPRPADAAMKTEVIADESEPCGSASGATDQLSATKGA